MFSYWSGESAGGTVPGGWRSQVLDRRQTSLPPPPLLLPPPVQGLVQGQAGPGPRPGPGVWLRAGHRHLQAWEVARIILSLAVSSSGELLLIFLLLSSPL